MIRIADQARLAGTRRAPPQPSGVQPESPDQALSNLASDGSREPRFSGHSAPTMIAAEPSNASHAPSRSESARKPGAGAGGSMIRKSTHATATIPSSISGARWPSGAEAEENPAPASASNAITIATPASNSNTMFRSFNA